MPLSWLVGTATQAGVSNGEWCLLRSALSIQKHTRAVRAERATRKTCASAPQDIGFVGEVTGVHPDLLRTLVADGYIPVLATVAADKHGQALNVNADIAAGEVRLTIMLFAASRVAAERGVTGSPHAHRASEQSAICSA